MASNVAIRHYGSDENLWCLVCDASLWGAYFTLKRALVTCKGAASL